MWIPRSGKGQQHGLIGGYENDTCVSTEIRFLKVILILSFYFIAMLSPHFSTMIDEQFQNIPNSTNAVESHNCLSKLSKLEIHCAALLTTYKVDMAALEHMARLEGLPTSYEDTTNDACAKKTKAVQRSCSKQKLQYNDEDGPPDKNKHFQISEQR